MLKKKRNAYKDNSCVARTKNSDMQGTLTEYLLKEGMNE